jgi:hypothetical protein
VLFLVSDFYDDIEVEDGIEKWKLPPFKLSYFLKASEQLHGLSRPTNITGDVEWIEGRAQEEQGSLSSPIAPRPALVRTDKYSINALTRF